MKILLLLIAFTISLQAKKGLERIGEYWIYGAGGFQCIDSSTCYAVDQCWSCADDTRYFEISRTKDAGKTWYSYKKIKFKKYDIYPTSHIEDAFFLDTKNFYIGINLMITNDGGDNFHFVEVNNYNVNKNIFMMDTLNGVVSSYDFIHVTNDGWKTQKEIKFENLKRFENPKKRTDSSVFMTCIKSKQGIGIGVFTTLIELNIYNHECKEIYEFPNHPDDISSTPSVRLIDFYGDVGVFAMSRRRPTSEVSTYYYDIIFNTKDGGKTWKRSLDTLITPAWRFTDIEMRDSLYGLAVGDLGKIYETTDGGDTWEFIFLDDWKSHSLFQLEFAGDKALIGSFNAGMFTLVDFDDTLSIETKQDATIWQSRDMLYTSPEFIGNTLFLYDLLGNLSLTAEIHSELNISHLMQGLYFYRIEESGVLVKSGSFLVE